MARYFSVRLCAQRFGTELFAFCLMPNHVHWIVAPRNEDSLSRSLGEAHGRYAAYSNALDRKHLWPLSDTWNGTRCGLG